jgi:hypothetical protein
VDAVDEMGYNSYVPTIPSLMITSSDGEFISRSLPITASIRLYQRYCMSHVALLPCMLVYLVQSVMPKISLYSPYVDSSIVVMWFIATGTVVAASLWAASRERHVIPLTHTHR